MGDMNVLAAFHILHSAPAPPLLFIQMSSDVYAPFAYGYRYRYRYSHKYATPIYSQQIGNVFARLLTLTLTFVLRIQFAIIQFHIYYMYLYMYSLTTAEGFLRRTFVILALVLFCGHTLLVSNQWPANTHISQLRHVKL